VIQVVNIYIVYMSNSLIDNIEELTLNNKNYRRVLHTTPQMQLVVMSVPYNVEIGMERHKGTTQFIKVEQGDGIAVINGESHSIKSGDVVVVPPDTWHNIISRSKTGLKLYTIYSPPEHRDGLVEKTKPSIK